MNKKGIMLLSGGLDSTLAAKMMLDQGVEVEAINFITCFCTCTKKGCKNEARKVSENLGIKLKMINVTKEYLEIIKNPKHGYGSNINPCIDCRIFMFKKAKEYMKERGASFIITGEVLGERPMSQRADMIKFIEKNADLKGLIVRPLSAKLFEPTLAEEKGIVDREKMLNISGRSRKPQIALAKELDITDYPCPAGGCLLTDPGFAKRMKDLIKHNAFTLENIMLLKLGRQFRLGPKTKLVVGRNMAENESLSNLAREGDIFFDALDIPGPIGLMRGEDIKEDDLELSAAAISRYSDTNGKKADISYWIHPNNDIKHLSAASIAEENLSNMRI